VVKPYRKKDPYASREAKKYTNPIASREHIMSYLTKEGVALSFNSLANAFKLSDEEQLTALKRRLRAMERDGQVMRNRRGKYALVDDLDLIRGRVKGRKDGYGLLVPDNGTDEIFLSNYQMRLVFPDDIVLVRSSGSDRRGRPEGVIVEVLERNTRHIVGRYYEEEGLKIVVPDKRTITQDILVTETGVDVNPGQYVLAEILTQPTLRRQSTARITEILGDRMSPKLATDIAIRSNNLRYEWPPEVKKVVQKIGDEIKKSDLKNREDLRDLPFVTIDGIDAKDFDDAVYCEPVGKEWRLYVAIADVSHYVKPNSALDKEAAERGNSAYFPGMVVPMLPEKLSNGLCSLNPEVDRLVMVCEMLITSQGNLRKYKFCRGVIHSHARLTYAEVARMLETGKSKRSDLLKHLRHLHQLYHALCKRRRARGALEFETTETRIIFDQAHHIKEIVPMVRNDAHKIIEECMLIANVAAAEFLLSKKIPLLFRVHEGPDVDRLAKLRDFLRSVGLRLTGGTQPSPQDYAKLLDRIQNRPDTQLIQTVLLRSLAQAVYTPSNVGHFGLAYHAYCHFTSPIRRYPDLITHRALGHVIDGKAKSSYLYDDEQLAVLGKHCSGTERNADIASRDVVDWLKCHYMQDKLGQEFDSIISDITSFGVFVSLTDVYVEGLVHITALTNDYYQYDATQHRLIGKRTNTTYQLGDPLRVQLARVDLDNRKIDFVLVDDKPKKRSKKRRK